MPALFAVEVAGFDDLKRMVALIEATNRAQHDLMVEANVLTRSMKTLVADGFQQLNRALVETKARGVEAVAATQKQITSAQQLATAWKVANVPLREINEQLLKQQAASSAALGGMQSLTLQTNRYIASAREGLIIDRAKVAATQQLSSAYGKISGVMAERLNLENGTTAAVSKRLASEKALLAVEQQRHASSVSALRDLQARIVAESSLSTVQKSRAMSSLGLDDLVRANRAAEINAMALTRAQKEQRLISEGLASSIDRTAGATNKFAGTQRNLHSMLRGVSGALGALWATYGNPPYIIAGLAATATAMKSIKEAANFEYITQYTQAMGDASDNATLGLSNMRKELAAMDDLRKSPAQLAEGLNELVKAGEKRADALRELPELTRFAVLGDMELAEASQLAVGQANAFGVGIGEAANMIAKAASISTADLHDMGVAMTQTTELGSIAKISFEEVAAGIALISNQGIIGEKAGTSFRTSIIRMLNPTEKLKGMMESLNVSFSAFNENGEQKSVQKMFEDLDKSIAHLTQGDKVAFLTELFSMRGMKGGANVLKEIAGGYEEMVTQIKNAAEGTTFLTQATDELKNTTKGLWEELKADALRAFTDMGGPFNEAVVNPIMRGLSIVFEGFSKTFGGATWEAMFTPPKTILQSFINVASSGIEELLSAMGDSRGDGFFESKFRWLLENSQSALDKLASLVGGIKIFKNELDDSTARAKEAAGVIEANRKSDTSLSIGTYKTPDIISGKYSIANKEREAELNKVLTIAKAMEKTDAWLVKANDASGVEARTKAITETWEWQQKYAAEQEKIAKKEETSAKKVMKDQETIVRERMALEKEARDFKTKMMADGLEKEQQQIRNQREDALKDFEKYKSRFSAADQTKIRTDIETAYVSGMDNAAKVASEKAAAIREKEQNELEKDIRRREEAHQHMYDYLAERGMASADVLLAYKKKSLDAELAELRAKGAKEEVITQYSAAKQRDIIKESLEKSTSFVDGFKYALMDAQDQMADFGDLGKEVFSDLKEGISAMWKSVLSGDFDSLGEGLKSMGDNLLDTITTHFSDILATKTLSLGEGLFGDLLGSVGLGGLFGSKPSGTASDPVHVTFAGGLGSLLGVDSSGGLLGGVTGKLTSLLGGITSGGPLASAANMALAASAAVKAVTSGIGTAGSWFAGMQATGLGVNSGTSLALIEGTYGAAKAGAAAGVSSATTGASTAAGSAGAGASGAAMGTLATFGVAVAGLSAIVLGIKALMPGSPTTMERLKSSGATAQTFNSSGLTAEMQAVTKSMHAMIPALGRVSDAAWDASTSTLSTAEGMKRYEDSTEDMRGAMIRHNYTFDQSTQSWHKHTEILAKGTSEAARFADSIGKTASAGSAAAIGAQAAANGYNESASAGNKAASAATSAAGTMVSLATPLNKIRTVAASTANPLMHLTGTMTNLGSATLSAATAVAGSVGTLRSAASSIQAILARSAAQNPSYKKYGGRIGYATGGVLRGGSYEKDDLYLGTVNGIAQVAMGGEYIMPQRQTKKYLPILEGMRRQEYAGGGSVSGSNLSEYMTSVQKAITEFSYTDYERSIQSVKDNYDDMIKQAKEFGANAANITKITELYNLQMAEAVTAPSKSASEALKNFRESMTDTIDATYSSEQAQVSLQNILKQARGGDFSGIDKVSEFLGSISINKNDYASALDYARAYWKTMATVSELEQLTGAHAKIPGYASGGFHSGGYRIVGEDGAEVEYTGSSRIYNQDQLIDLSELVSELRELRRDLNSGNVAIATQTKKTADALRRFEIDGMPVKDAV